MSTIKTLFFNGMNLASLNSVYVENAEQELNSLALGEKNLDIDDILAHFYVLNNTLKDKMYTEKANEVYAKLAKKFMCDYDEAGSIGKRYRREDEIGTPYCVTVDFDTLEDESVTIRDRDTMEQVRIKIDDVEKWIEEKIEF